MKRPLILSTFIASTICSSSVVAETFQAEDFLYSYDTTAGNTGGDYRQNTDVDIQVTDDVGGGFNVGWIEPTEWLALGRISVPSSGEYLLSARVASPEGGKMSVDLNGGEIPLASLTIPSTGGWQNWQTVTTAVYIEAGDYDLGTYAISSGWNFNWIDISPKDGGGLCSGTKPFNSVPATLPGKLQAENYDESCDNFIAFVDRDSENIGGAYREDAVDIEVTSDIGGGFNVGWTEAGESLTYTVNVAKSGRYNVSARVASDASPSALHLQLNGQALGNTLTVANTGSWQNWQSLEIGSFDFTAGQHVITLNVDAGGFNLNYLEFNETDSGFDEDGVHIADRSRGEWVLLTVPDTQHYSQNRASAPIDHMHSAFDWIVNKKEQLNIQFVQGLGDITESWNTSWEWNNSIAAWYKLNDQVPYLPAIGNHDDPWTMNLHFPISMFSGKSWWGGTNGEIENSFALMTIYNEDYMFINIETYDPFSHYDPKGLDFANTVIPQHGNRKVILATHDTWETNIVKDNVLTQHDNIVLSNAGHSCQREALFLSHSPNGNPSYNFVTDYQCDAEEVMLLRYYLFKPMEDIVEYYTYSPITKSFEKDASSQGVFPLEQADP